MWPYVWTDWRRRRRSRDDVTPAQHRPAHAERVPRVAVQCADVEVIQHISIMAVDVDKDAVRVDLYSGETAECRTVTYRFRDAAHARDHARTLRDWLKNNTDVTYVRHGEIVQLMDELAYLTEALQQ